MAAATETDTIGPESTMADVEAAFPGARRALFRKYHIGGCASCGFEPTETLAGVCERNDNLDVNEVLETILKGHERDEAMMIEPVELAELLKTEPVVHLLDIRTREEFEAARIEGSKLHGQDVMREAHESWDRASLIVFIDHQGKQSLDAASFFQGHGYSQVRCLRGGIDAWSLQVDKKVPRYRLG